MPSDVIIRRGIQISLLGITWVCVNATWGFTGQPTWISESLDYLFPLSLWLIFFALIYLLYLLGCRFYGRSGISLFVSILTAYAVGVFVGEILRNTVSAEGTVTDRLFFAFPIVTMFLLLWILRVRNRRIITTGLEFNQFRYRPQWIVWVIKITFVLGVLSLLVSLSVEFGLSSSDWWPVIGTIIALSLVNGFAEELIFRGFVFRALLENEPLSVANFMQALFFALMHLGASPSWIGSGVSTIVLLLLGLVLGTIVMRPGGIYLAIIIHMGIDIIGLSVVL